MQRNLCAAGAALRFTPHIARPAIVADAEERRVAQAPVGGPLDEADLHDNLGRRFYIAGEKENAKPIAQLL